MCLLKVLTLKKYFGFPRFAGVPDANSMSDGDQHRAGGPSCGGKAGAQEAPTADVLLLAEVVLRVDLWGH